MPKVPFAIRSQVAFIGEIRPHRPSLTMNPMASGAPKLCKEGFPSRHSGIDMRHRIEIAQGYPQQCEDDCHEQHAGSERDRPLSRMASGIAVDERPEQQC